MKIKIKIYGEGSVVLEFKKEKVSVKEILDRLGLLSSATIVVKGERVLLENELVQNSDELIIYKVQKFIG